MPFTSEEKEELVEYLLDLTNEQIGDFLREHDLHRSGTKSAFRERLNEAIKKSKLKYSDIVKYLDAIAPWGKQHVLLLKGPAHLVRSWREKGDVRAKLKGTPAEARLDNPLPLILPKEIRISVIEHAGHRLRVVAVRRRDGWYRDEEYDDERETPEGHRVELRAHVLSVTRGLVILEWDLLSNTAILQIGQLPAGEDYDDAYKEFTELVHDWLDMGSFERLDVRKAIQRLHALEEAGTPEARSHAISYQTKGGRHFGGRSGAADASLLGEVLMDEAMHNLREQGVGNLGNFYWLPQPGTPVNEEIHVFIVGPAGRIHFTTSNTEAVVRHVLSRVRAHCS